MAFEEVLGEGLRGFELRGLASRPEDAQAGGLEGIDDAQRQRRLGTDDGEADLLALRPRHTNNGNTIDLLGNGNIAAAVRWCYGEGQALMNKIRFGLNSLFSASFNDAYISGDTKGTSDLLWANRTVDVAGEGNETIAWDGFACRDDRNDDLAPRDVAVDPADIRKDRSDAAKTDAVALDRG